MVATCLHLHRKLCEKSAVKFLAQAPGVGSFVVRHRVISVYLELVHRIHQFSSSYLMCRQHVATRGTETSIGVSVSGRHPFAHSRVLDVLSVLRPYACAWPAALTTATTPAFPKDSQASDCCCSSSSFRTIAGKGCQSCISVLTLVVVCTVVTAQETCSHRPQSLAGPGEEFP